MSANSFSFGKAIELMKIGKRVARHGWNGANMFAYYVPSGKYHAQTEAIKDLFNNNVVPYRAYYALKTAQNDIACWTPSTSDTLANDWFMVTDEQAKEWCVNKTLINQ
ncbi:DUF2829 domain-containing protein [Vibrio splendidus]|uniref:DUF2829 domain-containing protein n=1 Tax=Vibrio splendidus TaxID=29497 RepID=UPI00076AC2BD|nr:DUF2829 domain-containing protein [Vibrio splendidus]PHX05496.1 hypothetical protein VSPL_28900 [Vibrio splendidus]